jgi:hypothetical protein
LRNDDGWAGQSGGWLALRAIDVLDAQVAEYVLAHA